MISNVNSGVVVTIFRVKSNLESSRIDRLIQHRTDPSRRDDRLYTVGKSVPLSSNI